MTVAGDNDRWYESFMIFSTTWALCPTTLTCNIRNQKLHHLNWPLSSWFTICSNILLCSKPESAVLLLSSSGLGNVIHPYHFRVSYFMVSWFKKCYSYFPLNQKQGACPKGLLGQIWGPLQTLISTVTFWDYQDPHSVITSDKSSSRYCQYSVVQLPFFPGPT